MTARIRSTSIYDYNALVVFIGIAALVGQTTFRPEKMTLVLKGVPSDIAERLCREITFKKEVFVTKFKGKQ